MLVAAGDKLGPYEVLAPIGAGGMGEVYRARDPRLDRTVAIKISNEQFTERFDREARAIAALNHPHICQLYDVGPNYLVMELVDGTPLKGPLPLQQAVSYAEQILDALDAAHCKGITHRDLKPANILVTKQGIKLLDFGLAKQRAPLKEVDTTLTALTGKGQIVGTLQYMSPEQLQGKEADVRSDLFSFGCLLYEMITGRRAFEGQNAAGVIAAILEREPALEATLPLERVVRRSLAKDPDQRFQTARDLKAALTWALEQPPTAAVAKAKRSMPWAIVVGVFAIVAAVALWTPWRARPTLQPLLRLDVDLGGDVSLGSLGGADVILSPDGSRLVYCSQSRLFTRRLDQANGTELPGTDGAWAPFFSPDGQWVAFFVSGRLKKVAVQGGAAVAICGFPTGWGGSWIDEGHLIAAPLAGALLRIPSAGGDPTPVTELASGEASHRWPQVLPGGNAVLFTAFGSTSAVADAKIEVMSFADRRRKTLQRGSSWARYLPSGHLVYMDNGTLYAVPFDSGRLQARGIPVPALENVAYNTLYGSPQLDFGGPGMVVYRSTGVGSGLRTLQWLDEAGRSKPLLARPSDYQHPRLSPEGTRLALTSGSDTWVYDWQRDSMTRLTFGGGYRMPIWSPDGRYIVFRSPVGMAWMRSDGAGKPQPLSQSKTTQVPWSFTADGKTLAYMEVPPEGGFDLWTVPLENDGTTLRFGKPEPFLQTPFNEQNPAFSPDGRWLAYASDESGSFQIYVQAFRGASSEPGGKWQISSSGGTNPEWSQDARELFFCNRDNQIMVTAYTVQGDSFLPAKPRVWSDKKLANVGLYRNYDVAPDGKHVVALLPADDNEERRGKDHVIFLFNFFDELRRRVPTAR